MAVACFIRTIDSVVRLPAGDFAVTLLCNLMDEGNSSFQVTFEAQRGADWRIQARTAVAAQALASTGETVDLVILPSLETI